MKKIILVLALLVLSTPTFAGGKVSPSNPDNPGSEPPTYPHCFKLGRFKICYPIIITDLKYP